MAKRGRRAMGITRRFAGKVRNNRSWFGVTIDSSQAAATFTAQRILSPADYVQANLQASAKLEAIYWHIVFGPGAAPGGAVNWAHFGIFVTDSDASLTNGAINDPSQATALTEERWLVTGADIVPTGAEGDHRIVGIVKQKVRLKDMDIRFVTSNTDPVENFDYWFAARLLVSY